MEIRRHCSERLPGGERLWRRAARVAGFKGTLNVIGLAQRRWQYSEMISRNRAKYGVTTAMYHRPNRITVFVDSSPCARYAFAKAAKHDSFFSLCHELGHYRQFINGTLSMKRPVTRKQWKADPNERGADAYARWLVSTLREKS